MTAAFAAQPSCVEARQERLRTLVLGCSKDFLGRRPALPPGPIIHDHLPSRRRRGEGPSRGHHDHWSCPRLASFFIRRSPRPQLGARASDSLVEHLPRAPSCHGAAIATRWAGRRQLRAVSRRREGTEPDLWPEDRGEESPRPRFGPLLHSTGPRHDVLEAPSCALRCLTAVTPCRFGRGSAARCGLRHLKYGRPPIDRSCGRRPATCRADCVSISLRSAQKVRLPHPDGPITPRPGRDARRATRPRTSSTDAVAFLLRP